MTWLIAIDESGDTGKDSRFFTMAAVIAMRTRHLLPAVKAIPTGVREFKIYLASSDDVVEVLRVMAECPVNIVYVTVDKHDYKSKYYGMYGNRLYSAALQELLQSVMQTLRGHDINVFVDDSSFITLSELKFMTDVISRQSGCRVKRCEKAVSHHNKCIQIADLVVGAVQRYLEYEEVSFIDTIAKKISVARKL